MTDGLRFTLNLTALVAYLVNFKPESETIGPLAAIISYGFFGRSFSLRPRGLYKSVLASLSTNYWLRGERTKPPCCVVEALTAI